MISAWLEKNAKVSGGVWLVFGKTRVSTLSANDALEEALCFGWIDGQMQKIDNTKQKYFSKRRANSVWSEKNKDCRNVAQSRAND